MAPKKRTPKASPASARKKPKTDPLLAGVVDAIQQAEGLDEHCRSMLAAGVPGCFVLDGDGKRHELQISVEGWVKQVLQEVQEGLEKAVKGIDSEVADADSQRAPLESKVAEATAALSAAGEVVQAKDTALAEATQGVESARARLSEAQAVQKKGESAVAKAQKDKQKVDTVIEEHLSPLKDEGKFQESEANKHLTVLTPYTKELGLDESLCTALPSACQRPPGDRTKFMCTVFEQFEAALVSRAKELSGMVEVSETGLKGASEASSSAEQELQSAEDAKKAAKEELEGAQAKTLEAKAALGEANAALATFDVGLETTKAAREKKATALDNFKGYNMGCFDMLREQGMPPAAPAEEAAPAEATEAAAPAAEAAPVEA